MVKTTDKGLLASARESARRAAPKLGYFTVALLFCAVASTVAAHAQTSGGVALGADGGPVGADYLTAGQGFGSNIGPILKATLPYLLGMLAIWQGPRIIKMLFLKFSH